MASTQTEPPPPLPSGKNRTRSRVFITAFVVLQFLVPLTYLLRDDATDERFTWRSLSASDAPECEARVTVEHPDGERELVELESALHEDWVDYVRLGRQSVVDAFLQQQCGGRDISSVEVVTRCSDGDERVFDRQCDALRNPPRTAAR